MGFIKPFIHKKLMIFYVRKLSKEVKYQRVMNILDILKKYELTNLALVNEKQE